MKIFQETNALKVKPLFELQKHLIRRLELTIIKTTIRYCLEPIIYTLILPQIMILAINKKFSFRNMKENLSFLMPLTKIFET